MKKNRLHSFLFSFLILILFTPFLAYKLGADHILPLKGAYVPAPKPDLTVAGYFDATFQTDFEKYWNETFWLRSIMVRTYNQILYSLYDKSSVPGVDVGKDGYLYETAYINSYYGIDFIGVEKWKKKVETMKLVKDSLKKYNCDLLIVMAPGKGFFYPEFIPDKYKKSNNPTNYETFKSMISKTDINHIDFNQWFLQNKTTSPYILYPKTGIHWSYYGMTFVADSLTKSIEKLRNIDIPELIVDSVDVKSETEDSDADIEDAMNLFWGISKPKMAYPRFHFSAAQGKVKPRVIVISDSFYWSMFNSGFSTQMFNDGKFWYYYKEVYPDNWTTPTLITDRNLMDEIKKTDIVIVISNDPNIKEIGWGFFEEAEYMFSHYDTWKRNKRVAEIEKIILANKEWYDLIVKKAADWKEPLDSVIKKDAIFVYEEELKAGK